MKEFSVRIPVSGYMEKYVEAEDEKEAEEIALSQGYDENKDDLYWETMSRITQGNVFYGLLNRIEVKEES